MLLDDLIALCGSVHTVMQCSKNSKWGVPECEGNWGHYFCLCKSFKQYGICSHVLAINHILKNFNVRYQLRQLQDSCTSEKQGKKRSKRFAIGGNQKTVEPALKRAKRTARDVEMEEESDDEREKQLQLGAAGF